MLVLQIDTCCELFLLFRLVLVGSQGVLNHFASMDSVKILINCAKERVKNLGFKTLNEAYVRVTNAKVFKVCDGVYLEVDEMRGCFLLTDKQSFALPICPLNRMANAVIIFNLNSCNMKFKNVNLIFLL